MVECNSNLNLVFHSLADETRRDILRRVSGRTLSVSALARAYTMSLAGVAKHIEILEQAGLVSKERLGKEIRVSLVPKTVDQAQTHLRKYEELWEQRFGRLDTLLKSHH
jgi:DNA-binding transcriptional ArsR family regulator